LNIPRSLLLGLLPFCLFACSAQPDAPSATELATGAPEAPPAAEPPPTEATSALSAVEPIPGWEKFSGKGIEIWLPESFQGGNTETDLPIIIEEMKQLGPEFEQIAQSMEQNASAFALFAFDEQVGDTDFLTNVNVVSEGVQAALTVDDYLNLVAQQLPEQIQVIEQEVVAPEGVDVGRFVLEFASLGTKQLMYVVKEDTTIWTITFSTGINEFEERLPTFEKSAKTFAKVN